MSKSMTGFGRSEHNDGKRNIIVEIKSVNHRYTDISVRYPKRYSFAEEKIKSVIKDTVKRGKVDVSLVVENITEQDMNVKLNVNLAKQYYENLKTLGDTFTLEDRITIPMISSLPDVMKLIPDVDDEDELLQAILNVVQTSCEKLDQMRLNEGLKLGEDIIKRGEYIGELVKRVEERSPTVVEEYKVKLHDRLDELIGDKYTVDQDRLALETAVFADKCSITEEIVRLGSHMIQLGTIVKDKSQPVGRKLDFLVQEINREVNTIGSKANDLEITKNVVEMKSEIEKIREQIQNIE